tara:strand:+ start:1770 stop:2006 length:237 start_codon:yes stop_codon:yes gene_type:complete
MKTLFERLKPEVKQGILDEIDRYPTTGNMIVEELKANKFWNDLKIETVTRIIGFTHITLLEVSLWDFIHGDKFLNENK